MSDMSRVFTQAVEALEDAHAYPMLSREYRAGVQRACQLFKQAAIEAADFGDREQAELTADSLTRYLMIDWNQYDDVDVRYRDGTYEVLHLAWDPDARERLRYAVAVSPVQRER